METTLLVVRSFGAMKLGTLIRSSEEMDALLSGEHAHHVVKVALPASDCAEFKEV